MSNKRRTFGQFETPPDVADLLLGFCLRRPSDRLLDPSCGEGAFLKRATLWQTWLADKPADITADGLWGVELDSEMAASARTALPRARIFNQNFFTLEPDPELLFDAVIGNPPYTRAEWFGRLHREAGKQLLLDLPASAQDEDASDRRPLLPSELWHKLDHRSGLHAYFLLHSTGFLREGGRLGFVVPNGWLDVAYGEKLKQFLLDHFRIVALIESWVERWFHDAKINTCLVVLERCQGPRRRAANLVRLIRLRRPLHEFIPRPPDDRLRPVLLDRLVTRLLPGGDRQTDDFGVRILPQRDLTADTKWGLALRAPAVYRRHLQQAGHTKLGEWATIKRGFTTGANAFFYLKKAVIKQWDIEPGFRRPVLKSLRGVNQLCLTAGAARHELLTVSPSADLHQTAVIDYIEWGESQGYHLRRTCAAREPWYALPDQLSAQLILPKGIWQRHFVPKLEDGLPIDQQLYGLHLAPDVVPNAAAALLNSAWFALQCELQGRVNFGEGVLWLAAYETGAIRLPDPRQLPPEQVEMLSLLFTELCQHTVGNLEEELALPSRQALDTAVFDLLCLSVTERNAVLDALVERVDSRMHRARAQRH